MFWMIIYEKLGDLAAYVYIHKMGLFTPYDQTENQNLNNWFEHFTD